MADKFESVGDKVLKNDSSMTAFAEALGDVLPYSSADVFAMLKQIQKYWDQDEGNTKSWTIKGVYGGAGEAINAVEFACDVVLLNAFYRENINAIMPYLPAGTTLRLGFQQLDSMMNHGLESYAKELLRKEVVSKMAKFASKVLLKELVGASKGAISAAGVFYQVVSVFIDAPSIDDLNKAWLSANNTQLLHRIMLDKNDAIKGAAAANRESQMADHELICSLYFASLKALGKHTIASQNKSPYEIPIEKDAAYLTQKLNRYESALTYSAYILSCKQNVVD